MLKIVSLLLVSFTYSPFATGQDPDLTVFLCNWSPGKLIRFSRNGPDSAISSTTITSSPPRPVAIDYDPLEKKLYYSDVRRRSIERVNADGTSRQTVLSLGRLANPDGLALDLGVRKLFYTDNGYNTISSIDMDGNRTSLKIHLTRIDGLDNPRAIVLNTRRRRMFWTDWGAEPNIATVGYDGGDITRIIKTGLGWPNGLAIDQDNKILFWCDAKLNRVESSHLDGTHRTQLLQEPSPHYFDIVFHDRTLYFTDWRRRAILTMSAGGGPVQMWNSSLITQPAGLHILSNKKTACPQNTYGMYCHHKCGKCYGDKCNNVSGNCPDGCLAGWHGYNCQSECPTRTYGYNCLGCGQCLGGMPCDKRTGYCLSGCQLGWKGFRCDIKCDDNTYGSHCVSCGHCAGGTCEQATGHCAGGCVDGWTGPLCKTKTAVVVSGKDNTALIAGSVGGSMAFILIALIIIIGVAIYLTRQRKASRQEVTRDVSNPQFFNVPMSLPPAYSANVMTGVRYNTTSDEAALVTTQAFGRPADLESVPEEVEKRPLP